MTKWHHVHCFPPGSTSISSAEMIGGFASLKVWKLGFWFFFFVFFYVLVSLGDRKVEVVGIKMLFGVSCCDFR